MCYYGWGNIMTDVNQPPGYDRVRKETVDTHINTLKHLEESFTSKHWMVRIFKVKPAPLLQLQKVPRSVVVASSSGNILDGTWVKCKMY